jgi:hypothetical protein
VQSTAGPLHLSFGPPLSSFIFFLMAAIKVINGCGHKSFKSMGVPSLKEMSNKWNGPGSSSPTPMGSDERGSWSMMPNWRDLVRPGQVPPWFLFDVVYVI